MVSPSEIPQALLPMWLTSNLPPPLQILVVPILLWKTWQNLGMRWIAAAQQDDRVGTRGRRPGSVLFSSQAIDLIFDYCFRYCFTCLMLKICDTVHVALPATQDKHESKMLPTSSLPPHTTILPPDRRERLWPHLAWGRSGMEQASEEGRGNNSTEESKPSFPKAPTINCAGAKLID